MHVAFQLIHPLFTEALSEMVSMEWQAAILKEGKQSKKAEVCQIKEELGWKSVAASFMG